MIYITRSDISWYSRNANAYQKPLMLSEAFDLTLICPAGTTIPQEIGTKCQVVQVACGNVRDDWSLGSVWRFMRGTLKKICFFNKKKVEDVTTGFDFPCLCLGWWAKRRLGVRWTVFCWDPPVLSWRDKKGLVAKVIVKGVDGLFKRLVRDADRLVLNIHPGMLGEMACCPKEGQLLSMPNGFVPVGWLNNTSKPGDPWFIGVLSNGTYAKGFQLVLDAFMMLATELPRLRVLWVGDVAEEMRLELSRRLTKEGINPVRFVLTGRMPQEEAFQKLKDCGLLLHPYLAVPSLKWNYPLKIVEYMSLGRALVASDLPGVNRYIRNYENGLLFKAGDVNELCVRLRAIAGNEAEQGRLGRQALQDSAQFEWSRLNQVLLSKWNEGTGYG